MRQKSGMPKPPAEKVIKDIRRATRKQYGSEEKIRIVLEGLRGEESIAALCRREGIAESLYYSWSKEFLEAGRKRLAGDMARAATGDEVEELRREARANRAPNGGSSAHPPASPGCGSSRTSGPKPTNCYRRSNTKSLKR
jgi:transposase